MKKVAASWVNKRQVDFLLLWAFHCAAIISSVKCTQQQLGINYNESIRNEVCKTLGADIFDAGESALDLVCLLEEEEVIYGWRWVIVFSQRGQSSVKGLRTSVFLVSSIYPIYASLKSPMYFLYTHSLTHKVTRSRYNWYGCQFRAPEIRAHTFGICLELNVLYVCLIIQLMLLESFQTASWLADVFLNFCCANNMCLFWVCCGTS